MATSACVLVAGDEMYFTGGAHAAGLSPAGCGPGAARRNALGGRLPPAQGAVVPMRTAMYEDRPDVWSVLLCALALCGRHRRAPTATATNAIVAFRRFNRTSPHDTSRRPQPLSLANYLPAVHAEVTSRLRALQVGRAISPHATT